MACECVRCGDCNGSGNVWFDMFGEYVGQAHCDDLDVLETCEHCGGSGITEVCYECQEAYNDEVCP
jgi:hypothetical protein